MAENEKTEQSPPPAKRGKGKLIFILAVVGALLIGAGAAAFAFYPHSKPAKPEAAAAQKPKEAAAKTGPLVEMKPLVANLNDPESARYIKVAIFIEAENEEAKAAVESVLVPIRSQALMYLSSMTIDQTTGAEGKAAVATHLREIFEKTAGKNVIRQVYFGEFVVQ
jgi:flagellar basal body-associated protein FliL